MRRLICLKKCRESSSNGLAAKLDRAIQGWKYYEKIIISIEVILSKHHTRARDARLIPCSENSPLE